MKDNSFEAFARQELGEDATDEDKNKLHEHLREIREWLDKRPRSVLEFVPPSPRKSRKQPR